MTGIREKPMGKKEHILFVVAAVLVPGLAYAHGGYADGGFFSGLRHPVLGFDHLLAMVSVGILSAQLGGRAMATVPANFVIVKTLGALLGMKGLAIPAVEYGIALSVVALGFCIASGKRIPVFAANLFVGFFAIFHGHAHGTEMPSLARPALYALGFVTGTAVIHVIGVLIGYLSTRSSFGSGLLRFAAVGIACVGLYFLAGS